MRTGACLLVAAIMVAGAVVGVAGAGTGRGTVAAPSKVARAQTSNPIYLNPAFSPVERATDLVSRMTLPEKAAQMDSSRPPAIPRLGVAAWGVVERVQPRREHADADADR